MQLERSQLEEVRRHIGQRIAQGLSADNQVVSALPAFFAPPAPDLTGTSRKSLVVDLGGTNMRAAVVEIGPGGGRLVTEPVEERMALQERTGVGAAQLFEMQARLAARLEPPPGLPVGYCFSYPSKTLPDRDAILLRWTKNIDVPGVVGHRVGLALRTALGRAGLDPGPVRVLNDTVAALLATGMLAGSPGATWTCRDAIGLIAGTGTNLAAFFDATEAPKLGRASPGEAMAINLESGNVDPPYLTEADDAVDAASPNPGRQRFEKAASGYYLPFIFKALHPDHPLDPDEGTGPLATLATSGPPGPARDTARTVLDRSADLIATALCAVFDTYAHNPGPISILPEGSLFWRTPGYRARVERTLAMLAGPARPFLIQRVKDANLYGAAMAAISP